MEARQGDGIYFEVEIQGFPEPEVKWYREDVEIVSSPDFMLSRSGPIFRSVELVLQLQISIKSYSLPQR